MNAKTNKSKNRHTTPVSPFCDEPPPLFLRNFNSSEIIKGYREQLDIDVSALFEGLGEIGLFECQKTKLQFFYPPTVLGDGRFYEALQQKHWYYEENKWEYMSALAKITIADQVLEIGCGDGPFLKLLKNKGVSAMGLELNCEAAKNARSRGLDVRIDDLTSFAKTNSCRFDVVCMFQLLEHIPNPKQLLEAAIACLRPNGRLYIAVPNNDGFIRYNDNAILNLPPHHQLRWTPQSLKLIAKELSLLVVSIENEPLQTAHVPGMVNVIRKIGGAKHKVFGRIIMRLCRSYLQIAIEEMKGVLCGQSVLVCYQAKASIVKI